tara:strand:- start:41 stop:3556 length:3516 start_codon:yes stop_codon:yes gene_type:complete
MTNCDETFQEIQKLQKRKDEVLRLQNDVLSLGEEPRKNQVFRTTGSDGRQIEIDYGQWWYRVSQDPDGVEAWAERAAGQRKKSFGEEGFFENAEQLVRNMGKKSAQERLTNLQKMTGDLSFYNEPDFNFITEKKGKDFFLKQLKESLEGVGVKKVPSVKVLDETIENVKPFLGILNNQVKLQVNSDLTNAVFRKKLLEITNLIERTGKAPSANVKRALIDQWSQAIFAHRALRIAKRRWGQLGQGWQILAKEDPTKFNSVYRTNGRGMAEELAEQADELFGPTSKVGDLVTEGSMITRVIQAIDKGTAGIDDLKAIQLTLKLDGIDPTMPLEEGWEQAWRRQARAGYKDSILFALSSQLKNNYIAQKMVFLAEGFKTAAGQGWELMELPAFTQRRIPGANETQLDLFKPYATQFHRNYFQAQLDGARMAMEAHVRVDDQIRQTFRESIEHGFFEADTPFAGAIDNINNKKGLLSIEDQYKVAQEVINDKMSWDTKGKWLIQARDKIHIGLKLTMNNLIEKKTGVKLPVFSALQLMAAVDQRAGLRAFMTDRMNDMMLKAAKENPRLDVKDWADIAEKELGNQLYQATPTKQNIKDYRKEFGVGLKDATDDDISAAIAMDRVGAPVLSTPEQMKSFMKSKAMRMQKKLDLPGTRTLEKMAETLRANDYGDQLVPFWRSASAQTVYDIALGNPIFMTKKLFDVVYHGSKGTLTTKMMVDAQSAALTWAGMSAMFHTLDSAGLIVGNGPPLGTEARRQWLERLDAEGKVPNSVFNIPLNLGGVGILNTLFMQKDVWEVIKNSDISQLDQQELMEGLLAVGTGQVMRVPGFKQFQMLLDALSSNDKRKWIRLGRFIGSGAYFVPSGTMRTTDAFFGTSREDQWNPAPSRTVDDLIALPDDDPLKGAYNGLKSFAYDSAPGIAHWMGNPVKEYTYLGRALRRPEGILKGQWPIGVPGIWEGDRHLVEQTLDRLGMYQPTASIMDQKIDGIPITTGLTKELNYQLGHIKANEYRGYSSDPDANSNGTLIYKGIKGTDFRGEMGTRGFIETTVAGEVDVTRFVDAAVSGRTLREALNWVLQSEEWADLEADPKRTTNTRITDRTPKQIKGLLGPWMLQQITEFYEDKAISKIKTAKDFKWPQYEEDAKRWKTTYQRNKGETSIRDALDEARETQSIFN